MENGKTHLLIYVTNNFMQNDKDLLKKKNDVFKSIMQHPKLSRQFRDAVNAPIGSTLREQAKPTFSIINKMGGVNQQLARSNPYNGQGGADSFAPGALSSFANPAIPNSLNIPSFQTQPNNGNLMIFPNVTLKQPVVATTTPPVTPRTIAAPVVMPTPAVNLFDQYKAPYTWSPTPPVTSTTWNPLVAPKTTVTTTVKEGDYVPGKGTLTTDGTYTNDPTYPKSTDPVQRMEYPLTPPETTTTKTSVTTHQATKDKLVAEGLMKKNADGTYSATNSGTVDYTQPTGFIPKLADWVGGKMFPTIGGTVKNAGKVGLSGALAIPAILGSIGQTAINLPGAMYRSLWSGEKGPSPWVSPTQTLQGQQIRDLWPSMAGSTSPTTSSATTPSNPVISNGANWKPDLTKINTDVTAGGISGKLNSQDTNFVSSDGYGSAAKNVSSALGGADMSTPLTTEVVGIIGINKFIDAIIGNEGSSPEGVINNPGNIKFNNLPGQIDSGVKASDGGTFASYATLEDGRTAIGNIILYAASGQSANYGASPTLGSFVDKYTNTGIDSKEGASDKTVVSTDDKTKTGTSNVDLVTSTQAAIKQGLGKELFAITKAKELMGGNLGQLNAASEEKRRKELGLEPLELELSKIKSQGINFIPTMQKYMNGRDQYLQEVTDLIAKTEAGRKNLDMGDPAVNDSYRKYLAYLYTLKGRQEQRYGNFLDSAVKDYNANVATKQSEYESVYNKYTALVTKDTAINQADYNDLLTGMAGLYQSLKDAPTDAANATLIAQQIYSNGQAIIKNSAGATGTTDPDYYKNTNEIFKAITDSKTENLAFEKIGTGGIAGILTKAGVAEKTAGAAIDAINTALANSLRTSDTGVAPSIETILKLKTLVTDFSAQEGWGDLSTQISIPFAAAATNSVATYVADNIGDIKKAIEQVANGKVTSESALAAKFPNVNSDILSNIFQSVPALVKAYGDPKVLMNTIFSGSDSQAASKIASQVVAKW